MMMTNLDAENITGIVTAIRPDWDRAGVLAALARCGAEPLADIARAAITAATDPSIRTPAVIPLAGKHWPIEGRKEWQAPAPPRLGEQCKQHLGWANNCPGCRADAIATTRGTSE